MLGIRQIFYKSCGTPPLSRLPALDQRARCGSPRVSAPCLSWCASSNFCAGACWTSRRASCSCCCCSCCCFCSWIQRQPSMRLKLLLLTLATPTRNGARAGRDEGAPEACLLVAISMSLLRLCTQTKLVYYLTHAPKMSHSGSRAFSSGLQHLLSQPGGPCICGSSNGLITPETLDSLKGRLAACRTSLTYGNPRHGAGH